MAPISKFNINPFLNQRAEAQTAPQSIITPKPPQVGGLIGATNPFNQPSFGHLAGISKNGPGSLLQTAPGETGLGDRAILAQNGELGRKLFINI